MIYLRNIICESKQSIINLGFPEIIAKLFYAKFGTNAYIIANWYKQYNCNNQNDNKWWMLSTSTFGKGLSLNDYVEAYNASNNIEDYNKIRIKLGLSSDNDINDEYSLKEHRDLLKNEIEKQFFNKVFFTYFSIISDIIDGKLTNITPYKNMKFQDAALTYDEKRLFSEKSPLKVYENGYKWINVGKKCEYISHYMKNCGSAGVMSWDENRTMIVLFDTNNNPHAIVTYSPNEKRISGDEGVAGTELKSEYHEYVIDLANILNVNFDVDRSKSKYLKIKYLLKHKVNNIQKLESGSLYDEFFKWKVDNETYYSNGNEVVSGSNVKQAMEEKKKQHIKLKYNLHSGVRNLFNHYNQEIWMSLGVKYIPINVYSKS